LGENVAILIKIKIPTVQIIIEYVE